MSMNFINVDSSCVQSIVYNSEGQHLLIQYNTSGGGGLYDYDGVPKSVYEALLEAESKGKFVNAEIKKNYTGKKVINEEVK